MVSLLLCTLMLLLYQVCVYPISYILENKVMHRVVSWDFVCPRKGYEEEWSGLCFFPLFSRNEQYQKFANVRKVFGAGNGARSLELAMSAKCYRFLLFHTITFFQVAILIY